MASVAIKKIAPTKNWASAMPQWRKKGVIAAEPVKKRDAYMYVLKPRRSGCPDLEMAMVAFTRKEKRVVLEIREEVVSGFG